MCTERLISCPDGDLNLDFLNQLAQVDPSLELG